MAPSLEISDTVFFVGLFISIAYILFLFWYTHKNYPVPFPNPNLLGNIVLAVDPGVDARKWNIVTSKVNDALRDRGH